MFILISVHSFRMHRYLISSWTARVSLAFLPFLLNEHKPNNELIYYISGSSQKNRDKSMKFLKTRVIFCWRCRRVGHCMRAYCHLLWGAMVAAGHNSSRTQFTKQSLSLSREFSHPEIVSPSIWKCRFSFSFSSLKNSTVDKKKTPWSYVAIGNEFITVFHLLIFLYLPIIIHLFCISFVIVCDTTLILMPLSSSCRKLAVSSERKEKSSSDSERRWAYLETNICFWKQNLNVFLCLLVEPAQ